MIGMLVKGMAGGPDSFDRFITNALSLKPRDRPGHGSTGWRWR
jgi:hypothetical protein